jgi:methanol--5-hydroxybenzimidazolylcobamide Co-methyltransferase
MHYKSLAIEDPSELIFGISPKPVLTRSGMVIGGGTVYPELNFTLPPMKIDAGTMPEVRHNYEQIIAGALGRAAELDAPGVVIEECAAHDTQRQPRVRAASADAPGTVLGRNAGIV